VSWTKSESMWSERNVPDNAQSPNVLPVYAVSSSISDFGGGYFRVDISDSPAVRPTWQSGSHRGDPIVNLTLRTPRSVHSSTWWWTGVSYTYSTQVESATPVLPRRRLLSPRRADGHTPTLRHPFSLRMLATGLDGTMLGQDRCLTNLSGPFVAPKRRTFSFERLDYEGHPRFDRCPDCVRPLAKVSQTPCRSFVRAWTDPE
jgi:hypothetical protein